MENVDVRYSDVSTVSIKTLYGLYGFGDPPMLRHPHIISYYEILSYIYDISLDASQDGMRGA